MRSNKREFVLVEKKGEAENVTSLFFSPTDGLGYEFAAGQYVNIIPPGVSGHGKSYTISSAPSEKYICLTVKRKGEVSSALIDLPMNSKLVLEGPYGYFYPEEKYDEVVMIAGGIGVTPFHSVIKDVIAKGKKTKVILFYSNQYVKDVAFLKELSEIKKNNTQITVVSCLTQEKTKHLLVGSYSRIDEKLLKEELVTFGGKGYYVCGSIGFTKDMWGILKAVGVAEADIFTEAFF